MESSFLFGGIFILLLVILFIGGIILVQRSDRKTKLARVKDRQQLTLDELYKTFYADLPRDMVIDVLKEISNATEIPSGFIRPQDKFNKELAPVKGSEFGDGLIELTWDIERIIRNLKRKHYNIDADAEMKKIETVDNYVRKMVEWKILLDKSAPVNSHPGQQKGDAGQRRTGDTEVV